MAAQSVVRLGLESNQYERGLRNARKSFDEFTKGLGAGVLKLTAVSAAITATTTALKVAKDAFFASERKVDEWGRTLESAKSIYQGFLNTLNTGDISGFLNNIDRIVTAARAAYDELDKFNSMKTIQAPAISEQERENNRLRLMIQKRRYIAPGEGTGQTASMATGTLLSDVQIRVLEKQLQNGMNKVVGLWNNEIKQSTKAIDAEYERQAATLGMSLAEFHRGTASWYEFDRRVKGAEAYRKWEEEHSYVDQSSGRLVSTGGTNPYKSYRAWADFRVDGEQYNALVERIQQRDQQIDRIYSSQAQAFTAINRAEGITSRIGGGKSGGRSGGGGAKVSPQQLLMLQGMSALNPTDGMTGFAAMGGPSGSSADMAAWFSQNMFGKGLQDQAREFGWMMQDKEGPSRGQKLLTGMDSMVAAMNQLYGGMEDMGIKLPKSMQQLLGGINGLITVIQAIQAAKEAFDFLKVLFFSGGGVVHAAQGMTVPGNMMSGDRVPALLNSGEVVLNRAQVGNLVSQFNGMGGSPTVNGRSIVTGEEIVMIVNNYGKRAGYGNLINLNRQ